MSAQTSKGMHTPGPWGAHPARKMSNFGGYVAGVGACNPHPERVAKVEGDTREQADANARLIAAAPELLAALEALCNAAQEATEADEPTDFADINNARAYIAKARAS